MHGKTSPERPPNTQPLVFFMPSAEGDDPAYVRFRASLDGQVRFRVIEYPSWRPMIDKGAGFEVIAETVLRQLLAEPPSPSAGYFLAGYSFGGFVACDAAHRLRELGRRVDFLGLIDTRRHEQVRGLETRDRWIARKWQELRDRPGETVSKALWQAIYPRVLRSCPRPLLREFGSLGASSRLTAEFAKHLLVRTRMEAMKQWAPKPLDVPTCLFRTDEFNPAAMDFGWGALCGRLEVIPVGASHLTLFEPANLRRLSQAFAESVQAAAARARSSA
jgi:thioesterase domain-containing protein